MKYLFAAIFGLGMAISTPAFAQDTPAAPQRVDNFRLIDHDGKSIEFYRYKDAPAVVIYIYGVGCPIVQKGTPAFERLKAEYGEKGVKFLMLDANTADTRADIAADVKAFNITAPVLQDPTQQIAKSLGVTRTAESIVVVPKDGWRIAYRGAVDDRLDYGAQKEAPTKEWLKAALDAVLAGQPVAEPKTNVKGCIVSYEDVPVLSYEKDIAPIVQAKCVDCHVEGGIGPFAFSNYKKLGGRADMVREVLRTKLMPPWHADAPAGTFQNDRSLSVEEERKLLAWIDQGAKRDEAAADPLEQSAAARADSYALGKPDLELQLPAVQDIPAEGVVDYRYITVPSGLTEDKWVKAIEVKPTNRSVVHHALIFVMYPKEYRHIQPRSDGGLNGYFGAYLPGALIKPYPDGSGQFLPKGSAFIFQMHYSTTGKAEQDQTRMGLYFHEAKPEKAFVIEAAADTDFRIPPNEVDVPVAAAQRFEAPVDVYGLSPHMHFRGGRARFLALMPDSSVTTMLNIPFYQFDWQPMYFFREPMQLPAGTRMRVEGGFDNSAFNPKNPNPNTWVFFGEQSFEEMFIGYVAFGEPRDDAKFTPREIDPAKYVGYGQKLTVESLPGTKWRMTHEISIEFQDDGVVVANDTIKGKWRVSNSDVYIESSFEDLWLSIMDDELLFQGRPMKRLQ
jgi:peroxiredoxin